MTQIEKTSKHFLYQSWWVALFVLVSFFVYSGAVQKKTVIAQMLQQQLDGLIEQKIVLLGEQEDLILQMNSQSDPAWIQLTLMKGLGLVPDGQVKVFFQPERDN